MQVLDSRQSCIIKSILFEKSLHPKEINSVQMHNFLLKIANKELTLDDWLQAKEIFDEPTFILHVCNGSLGIYNELKESIKNNVLELDMIRRGEHPFFVTEDDSKFFHATNTKPNLEIDSNSLGTSTHMIIHKMRNSNGFKDFTVEELRAYLLTEYHINPPVHVLKEQVKAINKALLLDFEAETKSYENDSSITSLVLKEARYRSTKLGLSYEEANAIAVEAKKKAKNAERRLARDVVADSFFETIVGSIVETHAILKKK